MRPHRTPDSLHSLHSLKGGRRRTLRNVSLGIALALTFTACGGDDEGDADEPAAADAGSSDDGGGASGGAGGGEQDAGFGGDGHWTAAQLCSLADLATMGALFPGVEVVESTGIDDPDWSRCNWDDAAIDPLDPASTLFGISANDWAGDALSDSFEPLDIPGTDQAVFASSMGDDRISSVLVVVGDQILTVDFAKSASGARDVAEVIATTWVALQVP